MTLFCENCSSYLGPVNDTCPKCKKTRLKPVYFPGPENGKMIWDKPVALEGHPVGRPVLNHGLLLVLWKQGRCGGGLSAIDLNGHEKWKIRCGEAPINGITIQDDRIYFCTTGLLEGGTVYCCRLSSGETVWQQNRPDVILGKINGGLVIKENRLFVPCKNGTILCLDAQKGEPVQGWFARLESELHWLIAANQSLIAISRDKGQIYHIDPFHGPQGTPLVVLEVRPTSAPLVWNGKLYIGVEDGRIIRVDLRQRAKQDFARGLTKITATPVVKNNLIVAGAHDHHVYAWDEAGQSVWKSDFASGHAISSSPAAVEEKETLAIGANDGTVYGVDLQTGQCEWKYNTGFDHFIILDVLCHDGIFYVGGYDCNEEGGHLYALLWHGNQYEKMAKKMEERGHFLEAADLFAVAAHYSHYSKGGRIVLGEKAEENWIKAGRPERGAAFWESMAKPEQVAKCWVEAAESLRGHNNIQSAEYYYEAAQVYWRLGKYDKEKACFGEAVELAHLPRLRLKEQNNPDQIVGSAGKLTIRIENVGYVPAENLHFDLGGSLLEPISFDLLDALNENRHYDLTFAITPTREEDDVRVEVSYYAKGRAIPFTTVLDVNVKSRKITEINIGDMAMSEIYIVNESGHELKIKTGDVVSSKIHIVNAQGKDTKEQEVYYQDLIKRIDSMKDILGNQLEEIRKNQIWMYESLKDQQKEMIELIITDIQASRIENEQMTETMEVLKDVLSQLHTQSTKLDKGVSQLLADMEKVMNDSGMNLQQKFELVIPLIPLLLNLTFTFDGQVDLVHIWKKITERFHKPK